MVDNNTLLSSPLCNFAQTTSSSSVPAQSTCLAIGVLAGPAHRLVGSVPHKSGGMVLWIEIMKGLFLWVAHWSGGRVICQYDIEPSFILLLENKLRKKSNKPSELNYLDQ